MLGGDIRNGDGTGACTVAMTSYNDEVNKHTDAEKNRLKFCEPYLLAMAADKDGRVGSQFMITLAELPVLDRRDLSHDLRQLDKPIAEKDGVKIYKRGEGPVCHTIFGRLIQGEDTIHLIEGMAEFKKNKVDVGKRLAKSVYGFGQDLHTAEDKQEKQK